MDIKEMLYEVIIPQFEKENTKEHTLRLVGKDLDAYISMVKNELIAKEVIRQIVNGKMLTNADRDVIDLVITESIRQEKEKILDIPSSYYKGLKYDVDIDITGESVDTRVRSATYFAGLQAITADPTITQDPLKKKFFFKYLEDGGVNPTELFDVEQKTPEQMMPEMQPQMGGGGVSKPSLPSNMMAGQTANTI
jgi:hypothetical protein